MSYRQDDERHWVAELECGHTQHVRHHPPWQVRPWVTTPEGRASRLGRTTRVPQLRLLSAAGPRSEAGTLAGGLDPAVAEREGAALLQGGAEVGGGSDVPEVDAEAQIGEPVLEPGANWFCRNRA